MLSHIVILDNNNIVYDGDLDEIRNKAYKVTGEKEKVENYIVGKNVLYKNIGALNSMAVVEEEITDNIREALVKEELAFENLTAEEYYVSKTTKTDSENMEELWKN